MGISVFKNGVIKECRYIAYHMHGDSYLDWSCPFCNLILHSDINGYSTFQDRRCNCGGSVSIDGKETQAEKTFKAQSNSETSYKN